MDSIKPGISVIMPVYNCEKYLADTIESVINQIFHDWELIIVDDGSKDSSGRICDRYAQRDTRIKVYHLENGGVSNARNYGLLQARNEFVVFLDADDLLVPETLQKAYESIGDCDLVIFGYETFPVESVCCISEPRVYYSMGEFAMDYPVLAASHLINSPWNKLYRKDLIMDNHLAFRVGLSMGEDLIFNLSYLEQCGNIKVIPQRLYKYRRDDSNSLSFRFREDCFEIQQLLKEETDRVLNYAANVVKCTSLIFTNTLIDNIKSCVYTQRMGKKEKKELIKRWICDAYFIKSFNQAGDLNRKGGRLILAAIKRKNICLIYYLYSARRIMSMLRKKIQNKKG